MHARDAPVHGARNTVQQLLRAKLTTSFFRSYGANRPERKSTDYKI